MSLTDDVLERLKTQILTVERAPGALLNEAELADEFGVSKTPVREALRGLAQAGWVVVLPRKGYIVRPVELRDVRDIFAIRRMIEPTLAAEAAQRISGEQLDALDDVVAKQAAAGNDLRLALRAARTFHLELAGVAGSHRTHAILADLVDEVRRLHYLLPKVEGHITSSDELRAHRAILTAVRNGDRELAHQLMLEHLNEVNRTLMTGFSGV